VLYADREGMRQFAACWRSERRGKWSTADKLSGFCLLLKRRVLEVVGGLDERSRVRELDEEDRAQRVKQVGFALAVARDLFVHHHGPSASPMTAEPLRLAE